MLQCDEGAELFLSLSAGRRPQRSEKSSGGVPGDLPCDFFDRLPQMCLMSQTRDVPDN